MATRCYFIRLRYVGQEAGDELRIVPAGLTHFFNTKLPCLVLSSMSSPLDFHTISGITSAFVAEGQSRDSVRFPALLPLPRLSCGARSGLAPATGGRRTDESSRAGSAFTMALELQAYLALYKFGSQLLIRSHLYHLNNLIPCPMRFEQ